MPGLGVAPARNACNLGSLICYINVKTVDGIVAYTSTDGNSYTETITGIPWILRNATTVAGNGLFVTTFSGEGDAYITSPDGVNWTERTLPISIANPLAIFAGGKFCLVDSTYGISLTSADGLTWSEGTFPIDYWEYITYSPLSGLFMVSAQEGATYGYATSETGLSWTAYSYPTNIGDGPIVGK